MKYNQNVKKDIIEWDITNWWKFIERIIGSNIVLKDKIVLDLGARNGGLSLFYALNGAKVTCSDLYGPTLQAKQLHRKYKVEGKIEYKKIDATNISKEYNEKFDIITFKSVLGGIHCLGKNKQQEMVSSIKRCLRPGGLVIFADNMHASDLHQFFRIHFRKYSTKWKYESEQEVMELFADFKLLDHYYCGVFGCFGLNETLKNFLGKLDTIFFERIIPDHWKYIGVFIYQKPIENESAISE